MSKSWMLMRTTCSGDGSLGFDGTGKQYVFWGAVSGEVSRQKVPAFQTGRYVVPPVFWSGGAVPEQLSAISPKENYRMPTYEYECEKCKRVFEEYQSITAEPLTTCRFEGCDGTVHRLFSAGAGIIFKGSGFYQTDYRSDSYKKKAQSESSGSSSSSSSSSDSKPSSSSSTAST